MYLGLVHDAERTLAESFRQVADGHSAEPDVFFLCRTLAGQCDQHREALHPVLQRYGQTRSDDEPDRLRADGLSETRSGAVGLLRDLQDLYLLASFVDITWTMIKQAAQACRDADLVAVIDRCDQETSIQLKWLRTRMKQAAPQALIGAP
jgi:hypothetical protein